MTILEQFKFSVHDDIISGPIVLITFPTPITMNESHYVAIAFDQGIEGHKMLKPWVLVLFGFDYY